MRTAKLGSLFEVYGLFVQSYRLGTRELQIANVVVLARIVQAASLVPCSICRYVSLKRKDT
jgi:hypothetical protein